MGSERVIWTSEKTIGARIVSGRKENEELYRDVLLVRREVDTNTSIHSFTFDDYSDHYCLYVNDDPAACITVTRALDGLLDCENFYPKLLLDTYHDSIVSASKFRVKEQYRWGSVATDFTSKILIKEVLKEQVGKGALLDIMNAAEALVPYYRRMGYIECKGYDYIHPIYKTQTKVMFLPADPSLRCIAQDIFKELSQTLSAEEVMNLLKTSEIKRAANL